MIETRRKRKSWPGLKMIYLVWSYRSLAFYVFVTSCYVIATMLEDDNIRFLMLVHPTWPPCLCHSRYPIAVRKTFLHLSGQAIATQKQIWSCTANVQCQNEQGTGSTSKRSQRTLGSFGGTQWSSLSGNSNLDAFLSTAISFKLFAPAYHVPPLLFREYFEAKSKYTSHLWI